MDGTRGLAACGALGKGPSRPPARPRPHLSRQPHTRAGFFPVNQQTRCRSRPDRPAPASPGASYSAPPTNRAYLPRTEGCPGTWGFLCKNRERPREIRTASPPMTAPTSYNYRQ